MKKLIFILTMALGLGLNAQTPTDKVSLYPNPASTSVNVLINEPSQKDVVVTVSDILGNKIETFKFKPGEAIHIDLSTLNLRNGMYLFKIESGDDVWLKRLVVKL